MGGLSWKNRKKIDFYYSSSLLHQMNATTAADLAWMQRCFDLARKGLGSVSPNPPVGAVLVYQNKILAEGYHKRFGGPHAEVEAIQAVPADKRHLIPQSTLYVSLEPCCITGKTPPCTDLILQEGIKDVRISAIDPNPKVAGQGIEILRSNGISVHKGIAKEEGDFLIRAFRTNILKHRPYVILKWAQSRYGISGFPGKQVWLSLPPSQIFSHQLRAENDAILVGARTVETDNPFLTTRKYPGRSPHRVIYDPNSRLNPSYHVFNKDESNVFYFSIIENQAIPNRIQNQNPNFQNQILSQDRGHADQILTAIFKHNIGTLVVEGGSHVHQMFIQENTWDEAWVIQTQHELSEGIIAPNVRGRLIDKIKLGTDTILGIANQA